MARWLAEHLAGEFAGLRGAGGPGREHEAHAERLAWNRQLAAAGWTCLGWPRRARRPRGHAGPAGHLPRGVRAGGRPGPGRLPGRGAARADADRLRHGGAAAAVPAADPGGDRAVVPGLLGAGRRLGPGLGGHPGRTGRGLLGDHRAEGVDLAGRTTPTGASCWPAPSPARGAAPGCPTCWSRCASRASRSGPIRQLTGRPSSTRCSSTARAPAGATWSSVRPATAGGWPGPRSAIERGVATLGQQVGFRRELDRLLEVARRGPAPG